MGRFGKSTRYDAQEVLSSCFDAVNNKLNVSSGFADTTNNVGKVEQQFSYSRKTADGQVKATAGFLHSVIVTPTAATSTSGTITIYDSATEANTVIATIFIPTNNAVNIILPLDVICTAGIYVGYDGTVTNHAVTVAYR